MGITVDRPGPPTRRQARLPEVRRRGRLQAAPPCIVWPPDGCALIVRARAHLAAAASPTPPTAAPEADAARGPRFQPPPHPGARRASPVRADTTRSRGDAPSARRGRDGLHLARSSWDGHAVARAHLPSPNGRGARLHPRGPRGARYRDAYHACTAERGDPYFYCLNQTAGRGREPFDACMRQYGYIPLMRPAPS